MKRTVNGNEYSISTKLGVTKTIKKEFGKDFNAVITEFEKLGVAGMVKLLKCGVEDKEQFESDVYDDEDLGLMGLTELCRDFVYQITYPGKTAEEVEKLVGERNVGKN